MSEGRCIRCGRQDNVEYGADGQPYCSSCIFYGTNKQCYRCRMYLPSTELQQYKGQLVCPYCLMGMREEDRGLEDRAGAEKTGEGYVTGEACDRCGRQLTTVYYYGGRKLCANCFEDAKRDWKDVGGERPPMPMYRITEASAREKGKAGFLESFIAELLGRFGIKIGRSKKEPEIVALEPPSRKPAAEGAQGQGSGAEEDREQAPMIEGPERKTKKRKGRGSQAVTFPDEASAPEKKASGAKKRKKGNWFEGFKDD